MDKKFEQPTSEGDPAEYFKGDGWELPTDLKLLDRAHEEFEKRLKEQGWDDDTALNMAIALREALANAMIHGNLGIKKEDISSGSWTDAALKKLEEVGTDKKVRVALQVTPDAVRVTVADEGEGFNHEAAEDPTSLNARQERAGRGTLFMRSFFDTVEYNEKGNEITLSVAPEGMIGKYDDHWPERLPQRLTAADVIPFLGDDGLWHWQLKPEKIRDEKLRKKIEAQTRR